MPKSNSNVLSVGHWGRFPTYQAKVGTGPSTVIIVRGLRLFVPGMGVKFAEVHDLSGIRVGCKPTWRDGYISKVELDRIYLDLI